MTEIIVFANNDQLVVSSREIAKNFEKNHRDVLRTVDGLEKDVRNFAQMFFETKTPDSYGRPQRTYLMNRDGFSLLAMGFTGKAALEWKLKYIAAFNAMEQQLQQTRPNLTELSPELRILIRLEQQQKQQAQAIVQLNQRLDQLQGAAAFGDGGWRRESARIIARISQARGGSQYIPHIYQEAYALLEEREHRILSVRLDQLRSEQLRAGMSKSRAARLGKMDAIAADPASVEHWLKILNELAARYGADIPEKE